MGNINNYLKETLTLALKKGEISAKDLSNILKLEPYTSRTKLLNLNKKRMIKRIDEMMPGGKV